MKQLNNMKLVRIYPVGVCSEEYWKRICLEKNNEIKGFK